MSLRPPSPAALTLGRHLAPPRFVAMLVLLPLGYWLHQHLFAHSKPVDSAVIAFDFAALVFLLSSIPLLRDAGADVIRNHADANNANRWMVLLITTLMTVVVLAAISGELGGAKQGDWISTVKLVGTLLLAWLFANTVYAMHYAHQFYTKPEESGGDCGGLEFPGTPEPDYADFLYFSFTLGMTFQTSDVDITSRSIRHVAVFHSFVAFVFNLGVIAFTINALSGS